MTEEIIIDGVNVAGCPNYYKKDGSCMSGDCDCTLCIHNDCYYKQLKRLEREYKELKEANQSLSMLGTDLASANETVRKEFFRADKNKDMWREKAEEYRSALEEIKNDLKEVCKEECDYTKPKFCGDCDCRYGQILDKINEVLQ